jgi:hypothetical protein
MNEEIKARAIKWLESNFDEDTRKQVKYLLGGSQ